MRLHLVTAPAAEPLTLADVKVHRRVEDDVENSLLTDDIAAARQLFEEETGRQVITATWRMYLDSFPAAGPLRIPKAPLLSVTSITYLDTAGVSQTWSSSEYDVSVYAGPFARPGMVRPKPAYTYPDTYPVADAVQVNFTAGYGASASNVPQLVKAAIRTIIGDFYEEREGLIVGTIVTRNPALERVLHRFRVPVYA